MAYQNIEYEKEDNIGIITLNRPEVLNALSQKLFEELDSLLTEIERDDDVGAYILTGKPRADGRPCFSAGGDLKQAPDLESRKPEQIVFDTLYAMTTGKNVTGLAGSVVSLEDLGKFSKLSIAAIDGICTAGGLELALGCDIILVSETAQISDLHVKNLGLIGGAAVCTRLARRVGVSKAVELCCTGDIIDGREAHRIGLANQLFSPDKLLVGAREMAKKIACMRPAAVSMVKATCKAIYDMDYGLAYRFADVCSMALHFGADEWRAQRWGGQH